MEYQYEEDDVIEMIIDELCQIGLSSTYENTSVSKLNLSEIQELSHDLYGSLFGIEKNRELIKKYLGIIKEK